MKFRIATLLALSLSVLPARAHEEVDYEITTEHENLREAAKHAISEGDTVLFDALLKAGLQINKPLHKDSKDTALHEAVLQEKPDMIRHLLQHGANPLLLDSSGNRPIDNLEHQRDANVALLIAALTREPTAYDKKLLLKIPVPVWHEVLGQPEPPQDPLAPPAKGADDTLFIPFVSINEEDPTPEMTAVLNAHFPNWLPGSRAEEAQVDPDKRVVSYRDKQSHTHGEIVQITLVPGSSKRLSERASGVLADYVQSQELPTYDFKIRRATGLFLSGGGWGGHVVLMAGYWVKVGTAGWDE